MNLIKPFLYLLSFPLLASFSISAPVGFDFFSSQKVLNSQQNSCVVDFPFSIKEEVIFRYFRSDCSCVEVELFPKKKKWHSGETGILRATFRVQDFSRKEKKKIEIWIKGFPKPISLNVNFQVPRLVSFSAKKVEWEKDERGKEKFIDFWNDPSLGSPKIKIYPRKSFSYRLEKKRKGISRIWVSPDFSSKENLLSVLTLVFETKISREKRHQIFLSAQ